MLAEQRNRLFYFGLKKPAEERSLWNSYRTSLVCAKCTDTTLDHSQKANYSFTTAHPLAPVVVFLLLHRPIHQQALEEGSQEFPELVAR